MVSGVRLLPGWVRPRVRVVGFALGVALLAGCGQAPSTAAPIPTVLDHGPTVDQSAVPGPTAPSATHRPAIPTARHGVPIRKIVGLGDSVMAGTACDCDGPVNALASRLEQRPGAGRITWVNLGADGATTADVGDVVESDEWNADIADADVVVIIVGANDLTEAYDAWVDDPEDPEPLDDSLAALESSLPDVLGRVKAAHEDRPVTYLVAGYWNVFAEASVDDAPEGYAGWSRAATDRANTIIARSAGDAGMTYVDLVAPFRGPAGDGDRPRCSPTTATTPTPPASRRSPRRSRRKSLRVAEFSPWTRPSRPGRPGSRRRSSRPCASSPSTARRTDRGWRRTGRR